MIGFKKNAGPSSAVGYHYYFIKEIAGWSK
jgi:hypothetical protein